MTHAVKHDTTVVNYVLERLKDLGIEDVFGVPGDYAFPVNDAIERSGLVNWRGSVNELNAAYCADGYARVHPSRAAALCTTYGVGELSALCGIAGAYSERLAVIHLVGMPSTSVRNSTTVVHHSLGTRSYQLFYDMAAPAVCARCIINPENAVAETERVLAMALQERRPVYIGIPENYANAAVHWPAHKIERCDSILQGAECSEESFDADVLNECVGAVLRRLEQAETAVVLAGIFTDRYCMRKEMEGVIEATGLPVATMVMDKSAVDESDPSFMGIYDGRLMNDKVREYVEGASVILNLGALMTDFSSGGFTAQLDPAKMVTLRPDLMSVSVGRATYNNVPPRRFLLELAQAVPRLGNAGAPRQHGLGKPVGEDGDKITPEFLYPSYEQFLRENDVLFAETGTSAMGLFAAQLPKGALFANQTLFGSIGWATPAAVGAAVAANAAQGKKNGSGSLQPSRRIVLVTGEGSHQLTVQEICQFPRWGLKPVIFVLENSGYSIERALCQDPNMLYNDVPKWDYLKLPEAFGCDDWLVRKAETCGELKAAMEEASAADTGCYIVVRMEAMAMPELMTKLAEMLKKRKEGKSKGNGQ